MSRIISADMISALSASPVRPVYLLRTNVATPYLAYCSLDRDLTWDGIPYVGNGTFLGRSSIVESNDDSADELEIILSGVSEALLSIILAYSHGNILGRLYLGLLNAAGALIADPLTLFEGIIDCPTIQDKVDELSLSIKYVSTLLPMQSSREIRYTDAMQKHMFPGDLGFEFLSQIAAWKGFWGTKKDKGDK
jgi:hypothetical protein